LKIEKQKILLASAEFLTNCCNYNPKVAGKVVEIGSKSLVGINETAQTTWTVDEFLSSKGITGTRLRSFRSSFGRALAQKYRDLHGRDPYTSMRFIDGTEREVKSYTIDDMDLFEEVWSNFLE
jgi:hypothetical protein